ncbi:MAG: patatin-like phospholipase family protein [Chitinophagales bacterium]
MARIGKGARRWVALVVFSLSGWLVAGGPLRAQAEVLPRPRAEQAAQVQAETHPSEQPAPVAKRPTVAVVLGGGAALGLTHIGLLQSLQNNGIPIDLIVGTSMGGIIGGLYAAGYSPHDLREIVTRLDYERLFLMPAPPRGGLLATEPFEAFLDSLLEGRSFAELDIPFRTVSTNLTRQLVTVWGDGPVAPAILASMSIPLVFQPKEIKGERHVDGGLRDSVPADVARELGADVVIAVELRQGVLGPDYGSLMDISQMSLFFMLDGYTQNATQYADVHITPPVAQDSYMDFQQVDYFIRKGFLAGEEAMPSIREVLDRAGVPRYSRLPNRNHSLAELQERLAQAYLKAAEAPRAYALRPTLVASAGSQMGLTAAVEASGGHLGRLRESVWYSWNFTEPLADHAGFSVAQPLGPWWTAEAYLKYHRLQPRISAGLAAAWSRSPESQAVLSVEQAPEGPLPRWRAEYQQTLSLDDRWVFDLRLAAGRQPASDLPAGPAPGLGQDVSFASARVGCIYALNPNGWPFWGLAMAYPHLTAEAERVHWRAVEPSEGAAAPGETWLRAGTGVDLRFFGFIPFRLTFMAGRAWPSGRSDWRLTFGRTLALH